MEMDTALMVFAFAMNRTLERIVQRLGLRFVHSQLLDSIAPKHFAPTTVLTLDFA